jgi:hypothetical protein
VEGPDLDTGLIQVDYKERQTRVFRYIRVGASQKEPAIGPASARHPDLLTVDDPLIAVANSSRASACEV